MDKSAIKTFAIWARKKLIEDVRGNANLIGITENGICDPLKQSTEGIQYFDIGANEPYKLSGDDIAKRDNIVKRLRDAADEGNYKTAYTNMLEHTASTWFNRLAAIRFMEVNEYFDDGLRVLSSVNEGSQDSDLMSTPFDSDLKFTENERKIVIDWKLNNNSEALFELLLQKKCRALGEILPGLFDKADDVTSMLMNFSIADKDGVVYHLTHDIEEDDWKDAVEIIGWLYQYYNEERRNEVINIYKGTVKKEDIPAATQLFTTDWVVRYMVDNSLGRYWIERNPKSELVEKLQYFVTSKDGGTKYIDEKITPENLTFFDPCMGSGHILVYAFDVLMEIYREAGYLDRDAVQSIIRNNLFGLDIDERAYQLAYFAVMMKARSYDRRFLSRKIEPNLAPIEESNGLSKIALDELQIQISDIVKDNVNYLIDAFMNAKEIGSLIYVNNVNFEAIKKFMTDFEDNGVGDLFNYTWYKSVFSKMPYFIKQGRIMSRKYAVVCTNPPYMNKIEGFLKKFVVEEYKDYCGDLFSVFMKRNFDYCKQDGYSAFMTPFVWMFIKTYEKLRNYVINNKAIVSLIQMEYSAFEEATVPICSFILKNGKSSEVGCYFRLSDYKGGMEVQNQKVLEALGNKQCGFFFESNSDNFSKIPGSPIAYWANTKLFEIFKSAQLVNDIAEVKIGMGTGKNEIFVRNWWEINEKMFDKTVSDISKLDNSNAKWFPYNKGGEFRLWYGNLQEVLWYNNQGREKMKSMSGHRENGGYNYYFKKGITWTFISSSKFGVRSRPSGSLFDVAGSTMFVEEKKYYYLLAFLSSAVANYLLAMLNPTLNYQAGNIKSLPIIFESEDAVNELSKQNVLISKADWNSFETSWDFITHPLIEYRSGAGYADAPIEQWQYRISDAFNNWKDNAEAQFNLLKSNEEELNRIFIDIYGLQDELRPEEDDNDVTVRKADLTRDIRSFVSYAVGCMFGRYSLDIEGLAYAGGDWNESKYKTFAVDQDNCIPITDEAYFDDDIVGRFVEFVRVVYGDKTLEENLRFIADALGNKGDTSRDVIRNYFLNDFFKDHVKIYQKRPIYWMFDSGKQNGFKSLVYMHRWNSDTIATVRASYVTKVQEKYENELRAIDLQLEHLSDPRQKAVQQKRQEKLLKQVAEIKQYDELISHLALEHIDIDLDDGVKVNYEKVQHDNNGDKYKILAPIK